MEKNEQALNFKLLVFSNKTEISNVNKNFVFTYTI